MQGNRRTRRRGAQAVEFALLLPVLLTLTGAIIDFGWYFSNQMILTNEIRKSLRLGAGTAAGAADSPCEVASAYLVSRLPAYGWNVDSTDFDFDDTLLVSTNPEQIGMTVTVDLPATSFFNFPIQYVPTTHHVTHVVRMEDQTHTDATVCP